MLYPTNPDNPDAGPWIAANHAGFMVTWIVGASTDNPGTPMWTLTTNNGFNWSPVCSILSTPSTTIGGPVGLSANKNGFVATWLDTNDSNVYASFYTTPSLDDLASNPFALRLYQKYNARLTTPTF